MYKPLKLIDAQELLLIPLNDPGFIVEDLIPGGVNVLAGDEKSGKSWMMLHMAICIATGQDFLGHPVNQAMRFLPCGHWNDLLSASSFCQIHHS